MSGDAEIVLDRIVEHSIHGRRPSVQALALELFWEVERVAQALAELECTGYITRDRSESTN